jgi:glucosamine--fructose-6-phosphate aminotransferase (isomerizing)
MAFLDEVAEQGKVLRDLIAFYRTDKGDELLHDSEGLASRHPRSITFAGIGTSEFVAGVVRDHLGEKSAAPVILWEAGELLHYGLESIRDDDVIVLVSQSGESIETRTIADNLRFHQRVISVTNNPESAMARWAKIHLPIIAGEEASISNKTYTNSMAILLLLSRAIPGEDWEFSVLAPLEQIADEMDAFFENRRAEIEQAADLLRDAKTVYFISRGPALVAARQAALTFQEGSHVVGCALPGGSMRHGPFEIVGQEHYAVMFASEGHGSDLVRSMALEMAELGSKVVLFTAEEVAGHANLASIVLTPGDPEFFPLACAVPQELLLDRMASDRGLTAGVFTRGSKITSKE